MLNQSPAKTHESPKFYTKWRSIIHLVPLDTNRERVCGDMAYIIGALIPIEIWVLSQTHVIVCGCPNNNQSPHCQRWEDYAHYSRSSFKHMRAIGFTLWASLRDVFEFKFRLCTESNCLPHGIYKSQRPSLWTISELWYRHPCSKLTARKSTDKHQYCNWSTAIAANPHKARHILHVQTWSFNNRPSLHARSTLIQL